MRSLILRAAVLAILGITLAALAARPPRAWRPRWPLWSSSMHAISEAEGECSLVDGAVDYNTGKDLRSLPGVKSAGICCAECEADADCAAWTWGAARNVKGLSDVCFIKGFRNGVAMKKVPKDGVVSGIPPRNRKHGFAAEKRLETLRNKDGESASFWKKRPVRKNETCPGKVSVAGAKYGRSYSLVNSEWNTPPDWDKNGDWAAKVEVETGDRGIVVHMKSRAYFADDCSAGSYNHSQYAAVNLLGKILRYTTDLSGAGCGCNAALYLVAMRQNALSSRCADFYCDASRICGVKCVEVNIQEANQYAWASRVHHKSDRAGSGAGYGGPKDIAGGFRDFSSADYAPDSECVNTSRPFQVAASFPVDHEGSLKAMHVNISQDGCSLPLNIDKYLYRGENGLASLTEHFRAGLTPVISYWSAKDMLWLDGPGLDGKGPCIKDVPEACVESVQFQDFSITAMDEDRAAVSVRK